jgi:hypothetical protein
MATKINSISKGIERICSSTIEWYLNGTGLTLSAMDVNSITDALIENRLDGELCTITPNGTTVCGWWSVQWDNPVTF